MRVRMPFSGTLRAFPQAAKGKDGRADYRPRALRRNGERRRAGDAHRRDDYHCADLSCRDGGVGAGGIFLHCQVKRPNIRKNAVADEVHLRQRFLLL